MGAVLNIHAPSVEVTVGAIPDGKVIDFLTGHPVWDTPEEYVRQNIEKALVRQYRYDPANCLPEFPIKVGSSTKRVDIVAFESPEIIRSQENAHLLVETKRAGTNPSAKKEGIDQLKSYMATCLNAKYGLWTNGEDRYVFAKRFQNKSLEFEPIDAGWLYLAVRNWAAQVQLKSMASGSVVDSTFPCDMESVILPPRDNVDGKAIQEEWEKFARAQKLESEALRLVDDSLSLGSEVSQKLSKPSPVLELEFRKLANKWRKDTKHISSLKKMISRPDYRSIIAMGKPILPLLLEELKERPDHWLVALREITGEDPASPESTFAEAVEAWLGWGRDRGYLR